MCRLLTAKSRSGRGASHQLAFVGSCLTIGEMRQLCHPSRETWLNVGKFRGQEGQRKECIVQGLEREICPRSVLDCGTGIK